MENFAVFFVTLKQSQTCRTVARKVKSTFSPTFFKPFENKLQPEASPFLNVLCVFSINKNILLYNFKTLFKIRKLILVLTTI